VRSPYVISPLGAFSPEPQSHNVVDKFAWLRVLFFFQRPGFFPLPPYLSRKDLFSQSGVPPLDSFLSHDSKHSFQPLLPLSYDFEKSSPGSFDYEDICLLLSQRYSIEFNVETQIAPPSEAAFLAKGKKRLPPNRPPPGKRKKPLSFPFFLKISPFGKRGIAFFLPAFPLGRIRFFLEEPRESSRFLDEGPPRVISPQFPFPPVSLLFCPRPAIVALTAMGSVAWASCPLPRKPLRLCRNFFFSQASKVSLSLLGRRHCEREPSVYALESSDAYHNIAPPLPPM